MSAERFTLDTNILVYSVDGKAGQKQELARDVIRLASVMDCHLTLQAICEFQAAATRKGRLPAASAAAQANDWLDLFPCIPHSSTAIRVALATSLRGQASFWDALLVATAAEGGCTAIITEGLADGSVLDGVRVVNPFSDDGLSQSARLLLS